ncbi:hypothetical protein QYE76_046115 [Lolium multiflorum]|uniref:DUF8039 domain-containing protein n=1 Tax=Lolium multiflorum TaxID=4521 RepID=A0AAD8TPA2_LOLMU|nr:hypothetical protein QYE76_046115 [Lolium multiflorum]
MKPNETCTIEVVDEATGRPLEPSKNATKFISQCGAVVRENVSITVQEWNEPKKARLGFTFVDKRTKKDCFKKLIEHFVLPPEYRRYDEAEKKQRGFHGGLTGWCTDDRNYCTGASGGRNYCTEPPRYPVDDIKEMKACHLYYPIGNMSMKVATGSALPPGALHHNNPIPDGYARVTVEEIVQGFEDLDIDIATPEGATRLGDVKRQFILWQKFIKFPGEAPRQTSPPSGGGGGGGGSPTPPAGKPTPPQFTGG